MQRLLSRAGGANWPAILQIKIYIILKPPHFWGGFFFILHGKEHQIFGIRAIIEAIQANYSRQSLYSKDASSELMKT
jgi:hypothetical protein